MTITATTRPFLSIAETIAALGVSRPTFYRLARAGRLHPRKLGRKTIVMREDIENLIAGLPAADLRAPAGSTEA